MPDSLLRSVPALLLAACGLVSTHAGAEEPVIYISAFAPGEQGAIHAYKLDAEAGRLEELHRFADVEHPFFLALSPNKKFLYSIHAPGQFGGEKHEQVAGWGRSRLRRSRKVLRWIWRRFH